ncbi:hypothetical protein F4802DRAFT_543735 [Xylaria palmicola]|nr:hypothetical protein F4802DRAFT_543735 [Xylaria palmicola]
MHTRNFLPFFASLASASVARRSIESGAHLYVYGVGINGFSVYADSTLTAVIADNATAVANGLQNTTWSIDTTGGAPWNVTITNSSETGQFYIVHDSADHQAAGFNKTAPTGAATTGFVLYGSTVEYSTGTTYESQFYARNSTNNIWNLMWNTDATTVDDGVPVVLKTIAPRPHQSATTTSA